mgnify:CR=1 FL=1
MHARRKDSQPARLVSQSHGRFSQSDRESPVGRLSHAKSKLSRSSQRSLQRQSLQFESNYGKKYELKSTVVGQESVSSRTQQEIYQKELAKLWDIIYEERAKTGALERQVTSLVQAQEALKANLAS